MGSVDESIRTCRFCKIEKSIDKFGKTYNRGKVGRRYICSACRYQQSKSRPKHKEDVKKSNVAVTNRNKKFIGDYLSSHPCVDCGETNILILDFDHVRGEKINHVMRLVNTRNSLKNLQLEIDKCDVRCKNCHTKITSIRRNDWRNIWMNTSILTPVKNSSRPWQDKLRNNKRKFILEHLLSNHCIDCGESDIRVLEFDHEINKERGISALLAGTWSVLKMQAEIAKCSIRCKNCHAIMTMKRSGNIDWRNQYLLLISEG